MLALAAFCAVAAQLGNKHTECDGWARAGECNGNPQFMNAECARSCAEVVVEPGAEMEQCPGWASQGECTRNPKFMMTTCPNNCAEQRAKVVDGLLDTSPSCIDSANAAVSTCVDMHAVPQPGRSRAAAGPQPGRSRAARTGCTSQPSASRMHLRRRATRPVAPRDGWACRTAARTVPLDLAPQACVNPEMAKRCPGSCASFELCASDADPAECRRALRCRELKDEKSDCASRVVS